MDEQTDPGIDFIARNKRPLMDTNSADSSGTYGATGFFALFGFAAGLLTIGIVLIAVKKVRNRRKHALPQ